MKSIKERTSKFWENHKTAIMVTAGGIAGACVALYGGTMFNKGFMRGGCAGFHTTLMWLDETFPEKEVGKAVNAWKEANPDKWVTF